MGQDDDLVVKWIRTGGVCGLLGVGAYVAAAFAPLPDVLGYAAAFAFGPLLAIGAIGLYYCLSLERRDPLVQIAAFFAAAGGVTVLIMLTTQQAIFGLMKRAIAEAGDPAAADIHRKIAAGLNAVHFGIDIAWDVLISVAVVLFGIAMLRQPRFGRVLGGIGVVLGGLLLAFNLWYFPTPPASAESIDWGPFVAVWFVVIFVRLLGTEKWARGRLAGET
jgi:magnesium-transporting ATPase (P-type)